MQQAVRATELMGLYQQRSIELARLRRVAIDQVASSQDPNFTKLAGALGLSKGRISQIRKTAPPPERILLGVGPVDLIVVGKRPYEKDETQTSIMALLRFLDSYRFSAKKIETRDLDTSWRPSRDTVLVLSPRAAQDAFAWLHIQGVNVTRAAGTSAKLSLADNNGECLTPDDEPWCYVSRNVLDGHTITVVASETDDGLLSGVRLLTEDLPTIYSRFGEASFSLITTPHAQSPIDMVFLQPGGSILNVDTDGISSSPRNIDLAQPHPSGS